MADQNVLHLKKYSHFGVYLGSVTENGEVVPGEQVGVAFVKQGSRMFRMKLWMFPNEQHFVANDDTDSNKYRALSLDEYVASTGETRARWNELGRGELLGCFIRVKLVLLNVHVFINLYPQEDKVMGAHSAA
jgi:hypothetical protein